MAWDDEWDTNWEVTSSMNCPKCNSMITLTRGSKSSKIAVISSEIDDGDEGGEVLSGADGEILRSEMRHHGIDPKSIFYTSIWRHKPNGNKECLTWGIEQAIKDCSDKSIVLLVGADAVKSFTDMSVEKCNGLVVKSKFLTKPILIACIKPTSTFSFGFGELVLAIRKLSEIIERNNHGQ